MQPHTSTDDAEIKRVAAILIASGNTSRAAIDELLDDAGLELDAEEIAAEIAAQLEEAFVASAFPGDASAIYGAKFHVRRRDEWERLTERDPPDLCLEDVQDHLSGRETIAITWPSRVSCAEIDLDAKDDAGLITLRSRVDRVISIFGAERCLEWHSTSGVYGGRRVRIVFDDLHDAVAVRRAVVERLEAAGLTVKGGEIEVWPNGRATLRAPLGYDSALVLANGTIDRSRSVAAWVREVERARAPIANTLPGFDEFKFAIEGTLIGRICEVVAARRLTSQKAIVKAVGGNTTAVRGVVAALVKAGGIKSEGQRAPFTVDLRRAALLASGAPCPTNNLIRKNPRGDQIRSDHDLKDPDLEGTPTGSISPDQVDRGTRGPTRRGKGSPLDELRLLEAEGCEAGDRNNALHRLAQLYVSEGLTDAQAVARFTIWLDRDDHRSKDLTGDRRVKVKAQMLAELPGAMQRWRDIGFGPARRGKGVADRDHAFPLIEIDYGWDWREKMRAELTDRDRARLTSALDAAGLALSATWRGRLEVLLAGMKRAAARGDAGVAVPSEGATRRIAGGRMATDDAGRGVAASAWLVELAKRVGILGAQLCGARREEQTARAYAPGALALEEVAIEIATSLVAEIEIAPTRRSDRFDDVIGHVELLFAGTAMNVADPYRFPKIERNSSWTLSY